MMLSQCRNRSSSSITPARIVDLAQARTVVIARKLHAKQSSQFLLAKLYDRILDLQDLLHALMESENTSLRILRLSRVQSLLSHPLNRSVSWSPISSHRGRSSTVHHIDEPRPAGSVHEIRYTVSMGSPVRSMPVNVAVVAPAQEIPGRASVEIVGIGPDGRTDSGFGGNIAVVSCSAVIIVSVLRIQRACRGTLEVVLLGGSSHQCRRIQYTYCGNAGSKQVRMNERSGMYRRMNQSDQDSEYRIQLAMDVMLTTRPGRDGADAAAETRAVQP